MRLKQLARGKLTLRLNSQMDITYHSDLNIIQVTQKSPSLIIRTLVVKPNLKASAFILLTKKYRLIYGYYSN